MHCKNLFAYKEMHESKLKIDMLFFFRWAEIHIEIDDRPYNKFKDLAERLPNDSELIGSRVHKNCRAKFGTHIERKEQNCGLFENEEDNVNLIGETESISNKTSKFYITIKLKYFIKYIF